MTTMFAPSIVIIDIDAGVVPANVVAAAAALNKQVARDFAPLWGIIATIRAATPELQPRDDEWHMELRKVPTIANALGFHDETPSGNPILYVFPELCAQDGTTWTSCASHEILETLVDPLLNFCAQNFDDGSINALEVCDAVETDTYQIDSVDVSNFVTRQYFSPPKDLRGVTLDMMKLIKTPYEIRPGGYGQVYTRSGGWQQIGARKSNYRKTVAALGLNRSR